MPCSKCSKFKVPILNAVSIGVQVKMTPHVIHSKTVIKYKKALCLFLKTFSSLNTTHTPDDKIQKNWNCLSRNFTWSFFY